MTPSKASGEKPMSEKKLKSSYEFKLARSLHDKFCKFNLPFQAPISIKILRQILEIYPNKEFIKQIDLPFKLNSLAWFMTEKGRDFLAKQWKRFLLDKKVEEVYDKKINETIHNVVELNQIVPELVQKYTEKAEEQKFGVDKKYVKEIKSIGDFLT